MKSNFRKDIQGLRAIAVISIFLYHLNLLEGGFRCRYLFCYKWICNNKISFNK